MKVFLYDGTFEGLLSTLYLGLRENTENLRIEAEDIHQPALFDEPIFHPTDQALADRLFALIRQEMSPMTLRHVYRLHLSEKPDAGTLLLPFLQLGFRIGPGINGLMTHPQVHPILTMSQQVSRESHRLLGLLRFQELKGGLLYARYEPDFHQTSLIAPHFAQRMSSHPWIIHDLRRELAACWDTHQWVLRDLPAAETPEISSDEQELQQLWQAYFQHIAIRQRTNPTVQRSFMPKKYWKHLVEKPGT
ncbi:TIGR03915 family putative DNA repair protein [Anoxynatronum sibiricum]|uniref:TIGR03915 family putative DNA repair protein n=1 Tax=Anoxynatronum sibiricum TaxID=210623 RepID=A0ABU9VTX4_9CLOT